MDPQIYKVLHLVGVMLVFFGIGAVVLGVGAAKRKVAMMSSGIGLLLLLVAGFGMIPKLGYKMTEGWVIVKMVIWVVMAVLPVLVKKGKLTGVVGWVVAILLGAAAAYLAVMKPF